MTTGDWLRHFSDEIDAQFVIINKLEERIKILELELGIRHRRPRDDEAGEEYWEHG